MRFITIDEQSKVPVLVWEGEAGQVPKVVSRHRDIGEVPDAAELEVWKYDVPLTTAVGSGLNPGHHPFVDAQGAPLWEGARIAFNVPSYYINTVSGKGALTGVDRYGNVSFLSDQPMGVYDRNGARQDFRREQNKAVGSYQYDGPFAGTYLMAGKIGDPHEHGTTATYIVLDEDPRGVCVPAPAVGRVPGA